MEIRKSMRAKHLTFSLYTCNTGVQYYCCIAHCMSLSSHALLYNHQNVSFRSIRHLASTNNKGSVTHYLSITSCLMQFIRRMSPTTRESELRANSRKHYDRCVQAANQITSVGKGTHISCSIESQVFPSVCIRQTSLSETSCSVSMLLRVHSGHHARFHS